MDTQSARDRADALLAAWNRRDYDEVSSQLTSDVVLADHTNHRLSSGSGFVDRFRHVLDAFPEMRGETNSVLAEGNLVVQETTWRGRHTAPLRIPGQGDVAPTNEMRTVHLVTYMEFDDDGKVRGIRMYGDLTDVPLSAQAVGVG